MGGSEAGRVGGRMRRGEAEWKDGERVKEGRKKG